MSLGPKCSSAIDLLQLASDGSGSNATFRRSIEDPPLTGSGLQFVVTNRPARAEHAGPRPPERPPATGRRGCAPGAGEQAGGQGEADRPSDSSQALYHGD